MHKLAAQATFDFMKPEKIKNKQKQTSNTIIIQAYHVTSRDAAPESHQVRQESLETFFISTVLCIKQGEKGKRCHPKLDFP